jgi:biotin carboxylase
MRKLLVVEIRSRGAVFHERYDLFKDEGYAVYYLTCSSQLSDYSFAGVRKGVDRDLQKVKRTALEWHEKERFDVILTTDECSVIATAAIAEHLGLHGIGLQAAKSSRNKLYMRDAHRRYGAPHPQFAQCHSPEQALAAAARFGYPVIIKPTLGASSEHVHKVSNSHEMSATFPAVLLSNQTYSHVNVEVASNEIGPNVFLVEEFIEGSEHCVDGFVCDGRLTVGSIADRISADSNTFDNDLYRAPTTLSVEDRNLVIAAVEAGAAAQGLKLAVVHGEVRFRRGRPYILEIAARPGGGSIPHVARAAYGYCSVSAALKVAEGLPPPAFEATPTGEVAIALNMLCPEGRIVSIKVPDWISKHSDVINFWITCSEGSSILRPPHGNDTLGLLGTKGRDLQAAMQLADRVTAAVEIVMEPLNGTDSANVRQANSPTVSGQAVLPSYG